MNISPNFAFVKHGKKINEGLWKTISCTNFQGCTSKNIGTNGTNGT